MLLCRLCSLNDSSIHSAVVVLFVLLAVSCNSSLQLFKQLLYLLNEKQMVKSRADAETLY